MKILHLSGKDRIHAIDQNCVAGFIFIAWWVAHFASRVCFYLEVKEMMQYIITSACPSFPEHLCSEPMSAETSGFILLLSGLLCAGSFEAWCIYFDYFCQIMTSLRGNQKKKVFVFHLERILRCLLATLSLPRFKCGQEPPDLKLSYYYWLILSKFWLVDKHPCGLNFFHNRLKIWEYN